MASGVPRKKKLLKAATMTGQQCCGGMPSASSPGNWVWSWYKENYETVPYWFEATYFDFEGNLTGPMTPSEVLQNEQPWNELALETLSTYYLYSAHKWSGVNQSPSVLGGGYYFKYMDMDPWNEYNYAADWNTDAHNDQLYSNGYSGANKLNKQQAAEMAGQQTGPPAGLRASFFNTYYYNGGMTLTVNPREFYKYYFGTARISKIPQQNIVNNANVLDNGIFRGWAAFNGPNGGDGVFATASALRGALYDPSGQKSAFIPCVHSPPLNFLGYPPYVDLNGIVFWPGTAPDEQTNPPGIFSNVNTICLNPPLSKLGDAKSIVIGIYGSLDACRGNSYLSDTDIMVPYTGSAVNIYRGDFSTRLHTWGPHINKLARQPLSGKGDSTDPGATTDGHYSLPGFAPNYFRSFYAVPTGSLPVQIALTQSNYDKSPKAGVMILWSPWNQLTP